MEQGTNVGAGEKSRRVQRSDDLLVLFIEEEGIRPGFSFGETVLGSSLPVFFSAGSAGCASAFGSRAYPGPWR